MSTPTDTTVCPLCGFVHPASLEGCLPLPGKPLRRPAWRRRGGGSVPVGASPNGGSSVKERLTPPTRHDTAEYAAFAARIVHGLGRRGRQGDLEAMAAFGNLRRLLTEQEEAAARGLHDDHRYSWAEIGQAVGMSRQAAHARWGS